MGPLKKVDLKFLYGWNISTMNPINCEVWYSISMLLDTCHLLTVASASLISHPVIDKILTIVFSLITTVLLESQVVLMLNTSLIIML